jgi:hypothetical protein
MPSINDNNIYNFKISTFGKNKYPNNYKNITLVFNDIDTMPQTKNTIQYQTQKGIVKHFYGYIHTLGGIVSMNAGDFEETNGFPNYWSWGYEDNMLQYRVLTTNGMGIDRSKYYPIYDKNFIMLHDGVAREVNRKEFDEYKKMTTEGYQSITGLKYTEDANLFAPGSTIINVHEFNTGRNENTTARKMHDLRKGSRPFEETKTRRTVNMFFQQNRK